MFLSHISPSHRVRRWDVLGSCTTLPLPINFPPFLPPLLSFFISLFPHLLSHNFPPRVYSFPHSNVYSILIISFPNWYQYTDFQINARKRESMYQFGSVRRSNGNSGEKDDWSNGTSSEEWCQSWGSSLFTYQSLIFQLYHSEGQIRCCLTRKGKRAHSSMGWE